LSISNHISTVFYVQGQAVFNEWLSELETRLRGNNSGLLPVLESHLAKYRSLMPSLALIYHLTEVASGITAPGPITESSAGRAVGMCEYLESHAVRVYNGGSAPAMESAREIIKHIQRGAVVDGCKPKDIYRNQWSKLTTPEEVKAGLAVLSDYEWLIAERTNTGGRPSEYLRLNPKAIK
jgi:hypothetical protein